MDTQIKCDAICCKNNKKGICQQTSIFLQGCSPDSDNVLACSEFHEEPEPKD